MRSIFISNIAGNLNKVYGADTQAYLQAEAGLELTQYTRDMILETPEAFRDVDYIFSTWGMAKFSEEEIAAIFPRLQCVFYGAGSVQAFARPFLNRGVKVFSAWAANAVPVAEYALAQILLANKGYFYTSRLSSVGNAKESYKWKQHILGNYDVTVGFIGVGQISRLVIKLLKNFDVRVKVCSRSLSAEGAAELGVERCSMEEIFATCQTVSNHLANNATTVGSIRGEHFASMLPYATFINTGRGAQVVEEELVQVLRDRPDLTAVLDVTYPEPPVEGHPFYELPNCVITPHIAGSIGNEVRRMACYMAEEFRRCKAGEPTRYEVSLKMLETMA